MLAYVINRAGREGGGGVRATPKKPAYATVPTPAKKIHFDVVYRNIDWWNPKLQSLYSVPHIIIHACERGLKGAGFWLFYPAAECGRGWVGVVAC